FLDVPDDVTLEATGPGGAKASYTTPTAVDAVDGERDVTCKPASGSAFPVGDDTVTCSSTDKSRNVGRTTFVVSVTDTTPPVFETQPSDVTVSVNGATGTVADFPRPAAEDLVDGTIPAVCKPG